MKQNDLFSVYVIHYSKLTKRKKILKEILIKRNIDCHWITEENFIDYKKERSSRGRILGVNEKLVGMDLGINSRSLTRSRKQARLEGKILFARSHFSRSNSYSTGSLPPRRSLAKSWLEVQRMHLTAVYHGVLSGSKWILVLEDDAIPAIDSFNKISKIAQVTAAKNIWINFNSGAGLSRTKSEKKVDRFGLFRIKPAATRCAVAYFVSHDLAVKIVNSAEKDGIPDWLPIDLYFQVLLRKFRSKAYWIEPVLFTQGSETGFYESRFENLRK